MKHSIKTIFKNLNTYLFFVFFVSFLALMLILEQQLSFYKIDNLNHEKNIIKEIVNSPEKDVELALIQFNAKSTKLLQNIQELRVFYKYNIFERFILQNGNEYARDLDSLYALINKFNDITHKFYLEKDTKIKTKMKEEQLIAYKTLDKQIDNMLLKSLKYNQEKFELIKYAIFITFILILLATFWYRKMLHSIYDDINYLFQLDKIKGDYDIFSMEADAIALRMNRKSQVVDNPHLIDPVTGINNYKGLLHSYSHKKSIKDSNFISVTILEIDNFSKSKRVYPQEIAQAMLKKVAYTISLHEQPVDVIARSDYNQFTIVLSRPTKEQAFKEVDLIRESIAELKFNIPNHGATQITVSGGFVIKPSNTSLEEALRQASEILEYAKSLGKNKIFQVRDLAQKEM
jgi:diguanylate cyclase (GGDEF)-like protein